MKTKVAVRLIAECVVYVEVEHEEDEDPTDLTATDRASAISEAEGWPDWEVESVMVSP